MRVNADTLPFLLYNALKDYINRGLFLFINPMSILNLLTY